MTDTDLLEAFLGDVSSQIDGLRIFRRVEHRYPFDSVASQFLAKALSLGRAILVLLRAGQYDEAFALARSLVECALTLRYMTSDQNLINALTLRFIEQSRKDRNFWLYWALRRAQTNDEKAEMLRFASERGYVSDREAVHKHWSGERSFILKASETPHPLDPPDLEEDYHAIARAADYYHPSCFVHCSEPGMEAKIDFDERFVISAAKMNNGTHTGERSIVIVYQYVKQIVSFAFYGMNFTPPESFTCLTDYMYSEVSGRYLKIIKDEESADL